MHCLHQVGTSSLLIKMNVGLVANILHKTTASYIMPHNSELTVIIIVIIVKFNLAFIFQLLYFNVGIYFVYLSCYKEFDRVKK